MAKLPTIQLKDFCHLYGFPDRQVRFVLEQGFVPKGVEENPATGNRREFGPGQAFWLAIVVQLRQNGLKTPVAAEIAELASEGVRMIAQNLNWDGSFWPGGGWFATDREYFLDVGDRRYIRLLTSAHPSRDGLYQFGWHLIKNRKTVFAEFRPLVMLRLDLAAIAAALANVNGWKSPPSSATGSQ